MKMMKSANMLRCAAVTLAAGMCSGAGGVRSVHGAAAAREVPEVKLEGNNYDGAVKLIDGITYVKIREFAEGLGARVTWNGESGLASVKSDGLDLTVGCSDGYFKANGYYLWFNGESFVEGERIYVPLRAIGTAFGYDTHWNGKRFTAELTESGNISVRPQYSADDLYWLSRIISAEAEGESFEGKLAVGTVVLNRVRNIEFPNTVYGVICDRKKCGQFTPVANGEIYGEPDAESILAAKTCLEGNTLRGDILFFMNASIAESFWISSSRRYVTTIGNHDFYA